MPRVALVTGSRWKPLVQVVEAGKTEERERERVEVKVKGGSRWERRRREGAGIKKLGRFGKWKEPLINLFDQTALINACTADAIQLYGEIDRSDELCARLCDRIAPSFLDCYLEFAHCVHSWWWGLKKLLGWFFAKRNWDNSGVKKKEGKRKEKR